MFESKSIYIDLTLPEIKSQISDFDIYKKYVSNFEEIDKPFLSDLYKDTTPSCRIYQDKNNNLKYKDFGEPDHYFNCFTYIMYKYNCKFKECLRIIANDFGLLKFDIKSKPKFILGEEKVIENNKVKIKSTITIDSRNWTLNDKNYWGQFGIDFKLLDEYDVIPVKNAYLHKGDRTIVFNHQDSNPIYAYRFTYQGIYSYKLYKPLEPNKKFKWLFSGGCSENIEGFDQLPLYGDLLIITKSLKDVICWKLVGYPAISLQGEANKLSKELVEKLKKRFNKFIVNYDPDDQGIKSAYKITSNYGFRSIIIPPEYKCKDLAEIIKQEGLKEVKKIINRLINDSTK